MNLHLWVFIHMDVGCESPFFFLDDVFISLERKRLYRSIIIR